MAEISGGAGGAGRGTEGGVSDVDQRRFRASYQKISPQTLGFQPGETFPVRSPRACLVLGPPDRPFPKALVSIIDELSVWRRSDLIGVGIDGLQIAMPGCNPYAPTQDDLRNLHFLTELALEAVLSGRKNEHLAADVSVLGSDGIRGLTEELTKKGYPKVEVRVVLPHPDEELVSTLGHQVEALVRAQAERHQVVAGNPSGDKPVLTISSESVLQKRAEPVGLNPGKTAQWVANGLPQLLEAAIQGGATKITGVNPWGKPLFSLEIDDQAQQVSSQVLGIPQNLQSAIDEQQSRMLSDQDRLELYSRLTESAFQLSAAGLSQVEERVHGMLNACRANLEQGQPLTVADGQMNALVDQSTKPSPRVVLVAGENAIAIQDAVARLKEQLGWAGSSVEVVLWPFAEEESAALDQTEVLTGCLQEGMQVVIPVLLEEAPERQILPPSLVTALTELRTNLSIPIELQTVVTPPIESRLNACGALVQAIFAIRDNAREIGQYVGEIVNIARANEATKVFVDLPSRGKIAEINRIVNGLQTEEGAESSRHGPSLIASVKVPEAAVRLEELVRGAVLPMVEANRDRLGSIPSVDGGRLNVADYYLGKITGLLDDNVLAMAEAASAQTVLEASAEDCAQTAQARQLQMAGLITEALQVGVSKVQVINSYDQLLYHTGMDARLDAALPVSNEQQQRVGGLIAKQWAEHQQRPPNSTLLVAFYGVTQNLQGKLEANGFSESVIDAVEELDRRKWRQRLVVLHRRGKRSSARIPRIQIN